MQRSPSHIPGRLIFIEKQVTEEHLRVLLLREANKNVSFLKCGLREFRIGESQD